MLQGIAAGFLAYGLFATSDACSKALGVDTPPYEILFLLTIAASVTFALVKPADERWRDIHRVQRPWLVFVRAAVGVLGGLLAVYSFTTLPLAEAYSLLFLMPAFATILSIPFLGESVGWRRGLAVLLGFVGVVLVVRPGFRDLHLGHLAAAGGAFCGAVSLITLRMLGRTEKRITLVGSLFLLTFIVDGSLSALHFHVPDWREIAILTIGGIAGGIGQSVIIVATRLAPPQRVAPAQYSQIVWAIIFGVAFFGEFPDTLAFGGIVLVIASGLFTFLREEQLYGWSRRTFLLLNRE